MRISVVIPFRNEERHIARCLEALERQDPFEVVAIADRSSDGSAAIVRRFPSVRLLEAEGHGPYAARNSAIAATSGDVLVFTDAECEPAPDWLARIASTFERPEVGAVLGQRLPGRETFALSLVNRYERAKDDYIFGGLRAHLYYGSTNNLAVRRDVLDELDGFAERRRGADTLLVRRLLERRGPRAIVYAPDVKVRLLEIQRIGDYYRKQFVYSRSMQRVSGLAPGRSLRSGERLQVWRATGSSPVLLALLTVGFACWELGRWSAGRG